MISKLKSALLVFAVFSASAFSWADDSVEAPSAEDETRKVTNIRIGDSVVISSDSPGRRKPEKRWNVRIGVGTIMDMTFHGYSYVSSLQTYYSDYHGATMSSGSYSIGGDYLFTRWFALGLELNVEGFWHEGYDGFSRTSTGTCRGAALRVMPQARFIYLNRPVVRLYGYIGVGFTTFLGMNQAHDSFSYMPYTYRFGAAGQLSPFGIELGRKLYGFSEIGLGEIYCGVKFGIGYRF